jgi:dihydroflavonol-4-reductase
MKAFVTGSTGLLGNNLVRLLIEQKHQVKASVRSKDKAKKIEKGKTGEKYIVGGEFYSMEEIVGHLAEVSGLPKLKLKIPNFAILTLANFSELFSRLTGKPAMISKTGVKTLQAKLTVDSSKAKRELGAKFRPISETLRDEVNWYRQNGYAS